MKNKAKARASVKAERDSDIFEWKGGYSVEPRYQAKMHAVWDRMGIQARESEWIDGELSYKLSGTKKALVKFLTGVGFSESDVINYLVKA